MKTYIHHSPPHVSVTTGNILITIIIFAYYHLLLAFSTTFMVDSIYLGTIQICQNLNEHYYYWISTTSVICQINANCSPFQSLNILHFWIRLERLLKQSTRFNSSVRRVKELCIIFWRHYGMRENNNAYLTVRSVPSYKLTVTTKYFWGKKHLQGKSQPYELSLT